MGEEPSRGAELLQSKGPLPAFPYAHHITACAESESYQGRRDACVGCNTQGCCVWECNTQVVVCGIVTLKLLAQQCGTN